MQNEKRLKQIDYSIIGIILFIFILIHSIYMLICEKSSILGEDSLNDKDFLINSIINRSIASLILLMFLIFNIDNYNGNKNQNQKIKILTSFLVFAAALIELYSGINNYIKLKDEEN